MSDLWPGVPQSCELWAKQAPSLCPELDTGKGPDLRVLPGPGEGQPERNGASRETEAAPGDWLEDTAAPERGWALLLGLSLSGTWEGPTEDPTSSGARGTDREQPPCSGGGSSVEPGSGTGGSDRPNGRVKGDEAEGSW